MDECSAAKRRVQRLGSAQLVKTLLLKYQVEAQANHTVEGILPLVTMILMGSS
ncbi:hypothetical protein KIN20_036930 [Parelaphostrongylus tenuis]|uniref:Uncharacterized protein n=1 Tax=Parelaphostrongylus tenuis TaxID=148309 RepID=A0AAD5RE17_PARTN|nr:hypothetical protein KIN20_036930 [Parelaphostrongylus tenuis]